MAVLDTEKKLLVGMAPGRHLVRWRVLRSVVGELEEGEEFELLGFWVKILGRVGIWCIVEVHSPKTLEDRVEKC